MFKYVFKLDSTSNTEELRGISTVRKSIMGKEMTVHKTWDQVAGTERDGGNRDAPASSELCESLSYYQTKSYA